MAANGRPKKFKSVKALQELIDAYFKECDPHWIDEEYWDYPELETREELEPQAHGGALKRTRTLDYNADMVQKTRKALTAQVPYTITGLAIAVGATRDTLLTYGEDERFFDTIKAAKECVHSYAERSLYGSNATGPIFNLKNNWGWKDEQQIKHSGEVNRNASDDELDAIIERAEARQASKDPQT